MQVTYIHIFQQLAFFSKFSEVVWFQSLVDLMRNDTEDNTQFNKIVPRLYARYVFSKLGVYACLPCFHQIEPRLAM